MQDHGNEGSNYYKTRYEYQSPFDFQYGIGKEILGPNAVSEDTNNRSVNRAFDSW